MTATQQEKPVRVRLAPSPTGPLHIGTARTALFNWLFAKQHKGIFILRIEDTDAERSEKKYEKDILDGLRWLGLEWDEGPPAADRRGPHADEHGKNQQKSAYMGRFGPYRQSERKDIYKKYIEKLLADGHAYYCYCTKEELEAERQTLLSQGLPPKYSGHCRNFARPPDGKQPQVIRFRTPEATVEFKDLIRGKVAFAAGLLGDMVIAKDAQSPLFTLAGVIDDELMHVTHVIRGEDHFSNTPKQILLQKALGFREPTYAHLPLILNPDRSKMSKRFADASLSEYRRQGYLPEALVNFFALLGWHPKDDQEIFSFGELIEKFDLSRAQKGAAVFDEHKLEWLQREHVKRMDVDAMAAALMPTLASHGIATTKEFLTKVLAVERERLTRFGEFLDIAGFFFKLPDYDAALLAWQEEPLEKSRGVLREVLEKIGELRSHSVRREELLRVLSGLIAREGRGAVLWPLRVAVSGQASSPDPGEIIEAIGVEETKRRLEIALQKMERRI